MSDERVVVIGNPGLHHLLQVVRAHARNEKEPAPEPPKLGLVAEDSPILREPCPPFGPAFLEGDPEERQRRLIALQYIARQMFQIMKGCKGVGLAAPQVGLGLRLIVGECGWEGWRFAFINPEIAKRSDQLFQSDEGCLSQPGKKCLVWRHKQVTVHALDLEGNPVRLKARGLLSAVLQHEIDHLDGVLMTEAAHLVRSK